MKTNVNIIKKLAKLGVLEVAPIKNKNENDIVITDDEGYKKKVLIEGISDEDLSLMVATEMLENIKTIKFVVKTSFILGIIGAGIWLIGVLLELGSRM